MEVKMGAPVVGTDGKLGDVHRVVVDARFNAVSDLVVKHGALFGSERMVPLSYVDTVDEEGTVHVKLDGKGFEAMNGFTTDHFRAPDPDYVGPPGFDRDLFLVGAVGFAGAGGGIAGKPLGFPGGEEVSPRDMERPSISPGTPILDSNGEKIGEVHELAWDAPEGAPTRLVMRQGMIFHTDTELPVSWIENLSDEGVVLNVPRTRVEALSGNDKRAEESRT